MLALWVLHTHIALHITKEENLMSISETLHAKGLEIGIYTTAFENELESLIMGGLPQLPQGDAQGEDEK